MTFLNQENQSATVSIRLTNAGRKLIANGFKLDNVFDMVKFSFGDSDIDYGSTVPKIEAQEISSPEIGAKDLVYKLYASGVEPSGDAVVTLSTAELNMTTLQQGISVSVNTNWPPIDGNYIERYTWTNLGPLEDYDFGITTSVDSTVATFRTVDVTGSTQIKIKGQTSGSYALLTLNIT